MCCQQNIASYKAYQKHVQRNHKNAPMKKQNEAEDTGEANMSSEDTEIEQFNDEVEIDDIVSSNEEGANYAQDMFTLDDAKIELAADLLSLKSESGVTDVAISAILAMFKKQLLDSFKRFEATFKSKAEAILQDDSQTKLVNQVFSESKDFFHLLELLKDGSLDTAQKRKTYNEKTFDFTTLKKIYLGTSEKSGEKRYLSYMDPAEVMGKFLRDPSVLRQYEISKTFGKDPSLEGSHTDFFYSQSYKKVMSTIPPDQQHLTPLFLGLYSDGFDIQGYFLTTILFQNFSHFKS